MHTMETNTMLNFTKSLTSAALSMGLFAGSVGVARAQAAPANDSFTRAQAVSGFEGRVAGTTVGATLESGENVSSPISTLTERVGTVWYRWVAPTDGLARFGVDGSVRGLAIEAYTGTGVSGLDDQSDSNNLFAATVFRAEAGQVYYLQVSSAANGAGPFALTYAHTPAPANDDFARALTLRGSDGVVQGLTSGSTNESGESGGFSTGSVWFRYVAPATGRLSVNIFGFSPSVTVYTGSAISNLEQFSSSRNDVQAGQTYYIQVEGRNREENRFFKLTFSGPGPKSFSLSGRVTRATFGGSLVGAFGARVSAGGQVTTTDGYGYYNFLGLRAGGYTVAASLRGFTLSPPARNVQLTTNLSTVDFRAGLGTPVGALSISGRVTDAVGRLLVGVSITRTGGVRAVTNGAGQYIFAGLSAGSYTLTPSRSGFDFNPSAAIVTVRRAVVPNINFYGVPSAAAREAAPQDEPEPSIRVSRGPSKYLLR